VRISVGRVRVGSWASSGEYAPMELLPVRLEISGFQIGFSFGVLISLLSGHDGCGFRKHNWRCDRRNQNVRTNMMLVLHN